MLFGIPTGAPAVDAFTQAGATYPVNIAYSGVTTGGTPSVCGQTMTCTWVPVFLLLLAAAFIRWLAAPPQVQPQLAWFKSAEPRLNHHLAGLFGVSSWLDGSLSSRCYP